jgi:hypothetical protein
MPWRCQSGEFQQPARINKVQEIRYTNDQDQYSLLQSIVFMYTDSGISKIVRFGNFDYAYKEILPYQYEENRKGVSDILELILSVELESNINYLNLKYDFDRNKLILRPIARNKYRYEKDTYLDMYLEYDKGVYSVKPKKGEKIPWISFQIPTELKKLVIIENKY